VALLLTAEFIKVIHSSRIFGHRPLTGLILSQFFFDLIPSSSYYSAERKLPCILLATL